MYKIGREVEVEDVSARAGDPLADRAAQRRDRRHRRRCPEHACEAVDASAASSASRSAPRDGIDLIAAAEDASALRDALLAAGAVEVGPEAAEILRIEAGTPRFGAEMGTATMPAEAGIVEQRGQLHQGLLHRPGDGRPPPLQGQAEPPPARAAAERARPSPARRCGSARRRSAGSAAPASPPPSGRSALAILRREAEPGAELAVGEDGVTARVVDLPFG